MVINTYSPTSSLIAGTQSNAARQRANDLSQQPQASQGQGQSQASVSSQRPVGEESLIRRVEASAEQAPPQANRAKINESEIREAQLVIFDRRSSNASSAFLQIQNLEEQSSIIDTFA